MVGHPGAKGTPHAKTAGGGADDPSSEGARPRTVQGESGNAGNCGGSAQKSGLKAKPRGRPIQKGQVLNPGGRPKMPKELKEKARDMAPECLRVLGEIMRNPESREGDRIRAAEIILNRAYGTPTQSVELSGSEGMPLAIRLVRASDAD